MLRSQRRYRSCMVSQKMRDSTVSTAGRVASRPNSSYGTASTYCRDGTAGSTHSTRCTAVPTIRQSAQLGHTPRTVQKKATGKS